MFDEHESARIELGRQAEVRLLCSVLCVDLLCKQRTQHTAGQPFSIDFTRMGAAAAPCAGAADRGAGTASLRAHG